MIKSFVGFALCCCLLGTALSAAFSEPAKAPVKDPLGGVTQISFTRTIGPPPDPREYEEDVEARNRGAKMQPWHGDSRLYEETVTFYRDGVGDTASDTIKSSDTIKTVTLSPSAAPNAATPTPRGDLAGIFRGWRPLGDDFRYLTKLLASAKFFEGGNRYVGGRLDNLGYPLLPFITISAVRNGTTKTVLMDATPPEGMWALQAALRGVASDMVWRKVDKTAEADGVKPK